MDFLRLNDYCLDLIFGYLNFNELLLLYRETKCLDGTIGRQLHRFREFKLSMDQPPPFRGDFLIELGRHLRSLHIDACFAEDGEVLRYLKPLCQGSAESRQMKALKIDCAKWTFKMFKTMVLVIPSLLCLDMRHCYLRNYQISQLLQPAEKLQVFGFFHLDSVTGGSDFYPEVLNRLPSLKLIHISSPVPISEDNSHTVTL
ncbi:uncharacterized protein LOC108033261 [Drosophila biarmipes]|uniref:uncharacterized protein LOC108033261 n=1 Tax=Drosophila biarmipes TaxID=125945 RepID=UPI0007E6F47F|nr:uncharacterized protein LOC108033261 [Drosophila biarmipes]